MLLNTCRVQGLNALFIMSSLCLQSVVCYTGELHFPTAMLDLTGYSDCNIHGVYFACIAEVPVVSNSIEKDRIPQPQAAFSLMRGVSSSSSCLISLLDPKNKQHLGLSLSFCLSMSYDREHGNTIPHCLKLRGLKNIGRGKWVV